ncbi:hypothetical protein PAP_05380 [Palaeococcus pacificus DY20341]|uniref:DUF2268 domain-containing protein n=1 Tax=Palaeococcus pacificus DY20341 TaxID=1343739 RepID=A0A075LTN6_9EURY|nr:hypothetical protein [Palaeococcus pacificus]AIF69481.1 hypothetical protein PAP_05380 [Palaeococcus pacificus DY20341]
MMFDTFSKFLAYWDGSEESWLAYINEYPELFEKIKQDYGRYGEDWHKYLVIPRKRALDELKLAHDRLSEVIPKVEEKINGLFPFLDEYHIVIYVGLGNGAGWVTEFKGKPAILFGLENIAELNWFDMVGGLAAHEFGHLVHWLLRGENIENIEEEQVFWLYTEGFAQRIEDWVIGRPWHLEEEGWFEWCEGNEALIKAEFLKYLQEKKPLNRFFGSWFEIFGKKFLGYYLGYKFIIQLERERTLEGIAKMDKEEIRAKILEFLSEG